MRYEITRLPLGSKATLLIDEPTFAAIHNASDSIYRLLQIEWDYDILVGNYLDLEKTILSLGLESFIHPRIKRVAADEDHRRINRMIMNLMTSARAFIDHMKHHVSCISGSTSADVGFVNGLFSDQYDRLLSYRVVEALRNYTQHCGLPTQGLIYPMKWTGQADVDDQKLISSVAPYLSVEQLRADLQFKKKPLEELEAAKGGDVPVMPLLREYVGSLSSVIIGARELYKDRKHRWFQTVEDAIDQYLKVAFEQDAENGVTGLAALVIDQGGRITEEIHLGVGFKERLESLEKANRSLTNLHKLQVIS